jgi:hypothetical protein
MDSPASAANLPEGVEFPRKQGAAPSASVVLSQFMAEARQQFPEVFSQRIALGEPCRFANPLINEIAQFEVTRGSSPQRRKIAQFIADLTQKEFAFGVGRESSSLEDAARIACAPMPLVTRQWSSEISEPKLRLVHLDREFVGRAAITEWFDSMHDAGLMTNPAREGLTWAIERSDDVGWIEHHLHGEKFALLGGTAELSPLGELLAAGADVFTTSRSDKKPEELIAQDIAQNSPAGRLFYASEGSDLLKQWPAIANTIIENFSEGRKIHVCALAYAGGQGQEWRLSAAMDAVIRRIRAAGLLASVTYYLSPSVITEISAQTAELSEARFRKSYTVAKRVLNTIALGCLWQPNVIEVAGRRWSKSMLSMQGASYIGANLFGKIYPAEFYSETFDNTGDPIVVSANVGPISWTRSTNVEATRAILSHLGDFGIHVFESAATRKLMYLLMIHDLFRVPRSRGALFEKQIHGGVFTSPWSLDAVAKLIYLRKFATFGGA